jgi:hypothetical protein
MTPSLRRTARLFRALNAAIDQKPSGALAGLARGSIPRAARDPAREADAVFSAVIDVCRAMTIAHMPLPDGESFVVEYVNGKSWSGCNWYEGGYRSLIQVNFDAVFIDRAIDPARHEGYPGHHVHHAARQALGATAAGWSSLSTRCSRAARSPRQRELRHRRAFPPMRVAMEGTLFIAGSTGARVAPLPRTTSSPAPATRATTPRASIDGKIIAGKPRTADDPRARIPRAPPAREVLRTNNIAATSSITTSARTPSATMSRTRKATPNGAGKSSPNCCPPAIAVRLAVTAIRTLTRALLEPGPR